MNNRYEIRLSGSGGQGLVLAGIILAEAASIFDGRNAVQTQCYGPESRGGASKSDVVISDSAIDYPKAIAPDLLLAMNQESCEKYASCMKEDGIAILDSTYVRWVPRSVHHFYAVPITDIAKEVVGKALTANMVALGVIAAISRIVSREALEQAVRSEVPKGTEEINLKALEAGFEAGENILKGKRVAA